jgi:fatty acid CoA ligase FadD36
MSTLLPALDGAFGDRPAAVRVGDESVSWGELAARAAALGRSLSGARPVAVVATPTLGTVLAVVACIEAGVTVVPIPPDSGPMEREHILRDSGAALLDDVLAGDAGAGTGEPGPGDPTMVVYTSGTTGLPKGVMLSEAALAADLDGLADAWQWTAGDTLVHGLPLYHVHGLVLGVLGALRHGSSLVHTVRPTPDAYAAAAGTLYFAVPTVWSRVCEAPNAARALRSARLLVSGSAALPVPVFDRLASLTGHQPVERYGMTETLITLSTRADGERRPGWVGVPLAGVEMRVVDEDGAPVAADGLQLGELQVRGSTLFDGYVGRPEASAAGYDGEWWRTGDAGVVDAGGFHRIVGRQSTDIIKSGGFKIGAGEVEDALLSHPAVSEAAVIGEPDNDLGQRVVAYVVAGKVTEGELIAHVATMLSAHKRPRAVRRVDALPRNALGKVQKNQLR